MVKLSRRAAVGVEADFGIADAFTSRTAAPQRPLFFLSSFADCEPERQSGGLWIFCVKIVFVNRDQGRATPVRFVAARAVGPAGHDPRAFLTGFVAGGTVARCRDRRHQLFSGRRSCREGGR